LIIIIAKPLGKQKIPTLWQKFFVGSLKNIPLVKKLGGWPQRNLSDAKSFIKTPQFKPPLKYFTEEISQVILINYNAFEVVNDTFFIHRTPLLLNV